MAASPQFVGPPRVEISSISNGDEYVLVTVFTAGENGSVVRSLQVNAVSEDPVSVLILLKSVLNHYQGSVTFTPSTNAEVSDGELNTAVELLDSRYFPQIANGKNYIELGLGEEVLVTVTSGGDEIGVGSIVSFRVEGADY